MFPVAGEYWRARGNGHIERVVNVDLFTVETANPIKGYPERRVIAWDVETFVEYFERCEESTELLHKQGMISGQG